MNKNLADGQVQVAQQGDTDIVVRRSFTHPPARVWRAMTDPAILPRWMATIDAMTGCQIDARPGGSFRYDFAGEGRAFYFSGPVLQADAPRHMAVVEYFNDDPASETHVKTDLAEEGTGTRMTVVMRWPNAAAREAAVASGRTHGLDEVYGRLDAVLTEG